MPISPPPPSSRATPWPCRSPEDTVGGLFLARASSESQEKQPGGRELLIRSPQRPSQASGVVVPSRFGLAWRRRLRFASEEEEEWWL